MPCHALPFRWCRFDPEGRNVETGDEWLPVTISYTYDEMGRVVADRFTGTQDDAWHVWVGGSCRYDAVGRLDVCAVCESTHALGRGDTVVR